MCVTPDVRDAPLTLTELTVPVTPTTFCCSSKHSAVADVLGLVNAIDTSSRLVACVGFVIASSCSFSLDDVLGYESTKRT